MSRNHEYLRWIRTRHTGTAGNVAGWDDDGRATEFTPTEIVAAGGGGGGSSSYIDTIEEITATGTIANTKSNYLFLVDNSAEVDITVPDFTSLKDFIIISKIGNNNDPVNLLAPVGYTINGASSFEMLVQYETWTLMLVATDTFLLY